MGGGIWEEGLGREMRILVHSRVNCFSTEICPDLENAYMSSVALQPDCG